MHFRTLRNEPGGEQEDKTRESTVHTSLTTTSLPVEHKSVQSMYPMSEAPVG
jgi:hypothetical protein